MALYVDFTEPALTRADADISMFGEGQEQPPGRSIMKYKSWTTGSTLTATEYDWSRIVAVVVDEPYLTFMPDRNDKSNPCGDAQRLAKINSTSQLLAAGAAALKSVAPWTRFWVIFNADTEVSWMMQDQCLQTRFNKDYIDVISLDAYWRAFEPNVKAYYDWIVAHRAMPQQQLALVPGTFFRNGIDDPFVQASYLQGYFDYANNANQQCNLSLGSRGVTGSYDGCLVWIVLGFAADTFTDPQNTTYVGELESASVSLPAPAAWIATVWRQEVALPVRPGLSYELSRQQIVSVLIQQWLND